MKKYKPVNWEIEHPCPQCGAPIILGEADRLLSCAYCRTRLYLVPKDYFRYYLPPADRFSKDSIFIPYWRLKGMAFFFKAGETGQRVLDLSSLASHHPFLPPSLGLRPQVLKLRFISPEMKAKFFDPHIPPEAVIRNAIQLDSLNGSVHPGPRAYKAFVGESVSLIYSPIFVHGDTAHDAILGKALASIPRDFMEDLLSFDQQKDWQIKFISTLCPDCGWDLLTEKDSVALFCKNCNSAWSPSQVGFEKLDFGMIPSQEESAVYLPFWRMNASIEGIDDQSKGDFKKLANGTRVIQEDEKGLDHYFWSPAFKVPPQLFLRLSQGMTFSQPREEFEHSLPWSSLYPVTLPVSEAVQAIKLTLAYSATNKSSISHELDELRVHLNEFLLIYIPFILQGIDFVQIHTKLCIPRNSLELGRDL